MVPSVPRLRAAHRVREIGPTIWSLGAGRVIAVDQVDYRLEFAQKFAQCETANSKYVHDMAIPHIKMTDDMGADVCIDAVGAEAAGNFAQSLTGVKLKLQGRVATVLHWCINSVRKGSAVSIVGVSGPTFNAEPRGNAVNKELTLRMNQAGVKRYLLWLIKHSQAGRVQPSHIMTHRLPLEKVADACHIFSSKLDNSIKTLLMLLFAGRVNMVKGIGSDLMRGPIPNIFSEMGGKARFTHNRDAAVKKAAVAVAA